MQITLTPDFQQQQERVSRELKLLQDSLTAAGLQFEINNVFVPVNYGKTIEDLRASSGYKPDDGMLTYPDSDRDNTINLVISPQLYSEEFDEQTRIFIALRELFRFSLDTIIPKQTIESRSQSLYFDNLSGLFTEYSSSRKALETIDSLFPETSGEMQAYLNSKMKEYTDFINDEKQVSRLNYEIAYFRFYRNVEKLINLAVRIFSQVSVATVRLYAIADHDFGRGDAVNRIQGSKLVTGNTGNLIEFLRDRYRQEHLSFDDGINLMGEYLEDFGMVFSDTEKGLQCRVADV